MTRGEQVKGEDSPLAAHTWAHRVVVVWAGDTPDKVDEQLEEFGALRTWQKEWSERELVLYVCRKDGGEMRDHSDERGDVKRVSATMCERLRSFARSELPDASAFGVYLVGKDGGIKHADTHVFRTSELYGMIDSMPMRQREMKQR